MSALALPTALEPSRPSAPQRAAGEADATGFKSLLETGLDKDAKPAKAETPDVARSRDEADAVPVTTALSTALVVVIVAVPVAPPTSSALEVATAEDTAAAESTKPEPDPSTLLTIGRTQPSAQISPAIEAGAAKGGPQPVASDAVEPDAAAAKSAAEAKLAAAAVPVATETAPQPSPPPPPLRALAERTSRPNDQPADKTPDASTSVPGATAVKASSTVASASDSPTAPDRAGSPADRTPRPTADAAIATEAPSLDAAPAADGATTASPGVAHARETSLSSLSRATIDATAQIAAQILRKLEGRSTRFEMALTPDDLGRVDVKLDIDSEGRLAARLAFDNPAAATDLRGRADQLRRELEDAGFQLADDAFEFAERDSGSSSFDRGQDNRHGQNRAFAAATRLNTEIDVAQPPRWMALSLSPAGVDLKV